MVDRFNPHEDEEGEATTSLNEGTLNIQLFGDTPLFPTFISFKDDNLKYNDS